MPGWSWGRDGRGSGRPRGRFRAGTRFRWSGIWGRLRLPDASRSAGSPGGVVSVTGRGCSSWCRRGGCTGSSRWRSRRCCWRWISPVRWKMSSRSRSRSGSGPPIAVSSGMSRTSWRSSATGPRWLLDVRPARLVKEDDATRFAAAAEAALEAGWRYSVVAGSLPPRSGPPSWGRRKRKGRARERAQGDQAARDRHGPEPAGDGREGEVVPLRWPEQTSRARDAIDAERRRRREQAAYAPVLRTFTKTGGSRGRRDAVLRPGRWGLENIPAFLPQDWYARHFMPIAGVSDRFIRRTAALRLAQMVAGGSLSDAAQLLGIASAGSALPGCGIYTGASHVHSEARKQYGPLSFENALEALARELGNPATPLVNYQARRQALQTWHLDEDTWTSITARLPPPPAPSSPTSGTENASSPPSTSGPRSPLASTSSPRGPSRPSCLPASGNPGPSEQVHGNCWTPATPGLTRPA